MSTSTLIPRRCACATSRLKSSLRSEEHTSELQSQSNLVCRLLLEKKKTTDRNSALLSTNCVRNQPHCHTRPTDLNTPVPGAAAMSSFLDSSPTLSIFQLR